MQFDPEHFHFSEGHKQNFLLYAILSFSGTTLTRKNFFEKLFLPNSKRIRNGYLETVVNLPGTTEMYASLGTGRDYEEVLAEIQIAYEYFYARWSVAHEELECIVLESLMDVLRTGGGHLRSDGWSIPEKDSNRKVLDYGVCIGIISKVADQYSVNRKIRPELLTNTMAPYTRVQHTCDRMDSFLFRGMQKTF